jgi:hypothetical protein
VIAYRTQWWDVMVVTSDMNVKYPSENESDFESDNLDEIYETGTDKKVLTAVMFPHCNVH